jgi:hypothetical protein
MNLKKYQESQFRSKVEETVRQLQELRLEPGSPDISFGEFVQEKHGVSLEAFMYDLGIDPNVTTIQNLFTTPREEDIRWILPEIIREALLAGIRTAPIWSAITAAESPTSGLQQLMPHINMSDAAPRKVGEAETIPLGSISYGQKRFEIFKIGRGIKIPYEVSQYTTLAVVSIFMRDFGVKLGHALDTLAIDCLINGEQANGSESAPVIGVTTANTKAYKDYLRLWIRAARMGRSLNTIIGNEAEALLTLDMPEFKDRKSGTTEHTLTLKTPVPRDASYYIHGNVPPAQEIMVDPNAALLKFNAQPLLIESEKIVSNQTEAFYVTLTTGFAKLFRDGAVILDKSVTIGAAPFPAYMEVDDVLNVPIL